MADLQSFISHMFDCYCTFQGSKPSCHDREIELKQNVWNFTDSSFIIDEILFNEDDDYVFAFFQSKNSVTTMIIPG